MSRRGARSKQRLLYGTEHSPQCSLVNEKFAINCTLSGDEQKEEYLRALNEGIITTWGICLLYRERARDRLQEIEAHRPIAPALGLLLGFN